MQILNDAHLEDLMNQHRENVALYQAQQSETQPEDVTLSTQEQVAGESGDTVAADAGGIALEGVIDEDLSADTTRPEEVIDPEKAVKKFESSLGLLSPYENTSGLTEVSAKAIEALTSADQQDPEILLGARIALMCGSAEERMALVVLDVCTRDRNQATAIEAAQNEARATGNYLGYDEESKIREEDWESNKTDLSASLHALEIVSPELLTQTKDVLSCLESDSESPGALRRQTMDLAGSLFLKLMTEADESDIGDLVDIYTHVVGGEYHGLDFSVADVVQQDVEKNSASLMAFVEKISEEKDTRTKLGALHIVDGVARMMTPLRGFDRNEEFTVEEQRTNELCKQIKACCFNAISEEEKQYLGIEWQDYISYPASLKFLDQLDGMGVTKQTMVTIRRFSSRITTADLEDLASLQEKEERTIDLQKFADIVESLDEEAVNKLSWALGSCGVYSGVERLALMSEVAELMSDIDPERQRAINFDTLCWIVESTDRGFGVNSSLTDTIKELNSLSDTLDVNALVELCRSSPATVDTIVALMKQDQEKARFVIDNLSKVLNSESLLQLLHEGFEAEENYYGKKISLAEWIVKESEHEFDKESFNKLIDLICTDNFTNLIQKYKDESGEDRHGAVIFDQLYKYAFSEYSDFDVALAALSRQQVVDFIKNLPQKDEFDRNAHFDASFIKLVLDATKDPAQIENFMEVFESLGPQLTAHELDVEFIKKLSRSYSYDLRKDLEKFTNFMPIFTSENFGKLQTGVRKEMVRHFLDIDLGKNDIEKINRTINLLIESGLHDLINDGCDREYEYVAISAQMKDMFDMLLSVENPAEKLSQIKEAIVNEDGFLDSIRSLQSQYRVRIVAGILSSNNISEYVNSVARIEKETALFDFVSINGPGYSLQYQILDGVFGSVNPLATARTYMGMFEGDMSLWALNYEVSRIKIGEVNDKGYQSGMVVSSIPRALPLQKGLDHESELQVYEQIELQDWLSMDLEQRRMWANLDGMSDQDVMELQSIHFTQLRPDTQAALLAYRLFEAVVLSRSDERKQLRTEQNRQLAESGEFWHEGDLVHATSPSSLGAILTNGILSGESIGFGSSTDSYPFNLDTVTVSPDVLTGSSHGDRVSLLKNRYFGEVCLVLRRDDQSLRYDEEFPGGMNGDHRLVFGGMPSTEISAVFLRPSTDTDELALGEYVISRIVETGVYVPVVSSSGELLFTYGDYLERRESGNYDRVTVEVVDSSFRRANTQKGSNEGAEFIVPLGDGKNETWYVKFGDNNPDHIWNELLADRLYALVAPEIVPETKIVHVEGRLARASRMATEDEGGVIADALDRGFILDSWLGNWDAVYNPANIFMSGGVGMRIDTGNTLLFRARGERKTDDAFGPVVTELEMGSDNQRLGGGMRQMYPDLTDDEIKQQVIELKERATDEAIDGLVDSVRLPRDLRNRYKQILKQRRDYILNYFSGLLI